LAGQRLIGCAICRWLQNNWGRQFWGVLQKRTYDIGHDPAKPQSKAERLEWRERARSCKDLHLQ
jgi:hypothetical protein